MSNRFNYRYLNCVVYTLALFLFLFKGGSAYSQSLVIDSLKRTLNAAADKQKPIILAELARASFDKNAAEAFRYVRQSLELAKKNDDAGAKAFAYASMAHLLLLKDDDKKSAAHIDSAMKCAAKTTDKEMAAFAWFRKGWFDLVKGNNDKAIPSLLKAEQLIQNDGSRRASSYKTLINHYVSSIYAYGSDTLKQHKYALACLTMARQSGLPDDMQMGYMTLAHSFFSAFERKMTNRTLLDSSMYYFRLAGKVYKSNPEKIIVQSNASTTALNLANIYFKYYPAAYKDSAITYVNQALSIARRTSGREIIANCYGILSEYALRAGDFKKAEQYLVTGISELANAAPGVDITRSRMLLGLANVAEQSGNSAKALNYYKQYVNYYSKVFDAQKLAITQKLEEEYQSAQRENEIVRLRERDEYNRRLNWLYVAIGSASIVLLGLLLSSYHYKLKAAQQQKRLTEQQNEEHKLLAQLQQAEAQRLLLEKQEAELQASLREEERAKAEAQQELLQDRTEWLEKELLAGTLKIEEKNAILELLKEKARNAGSPVVTRQIGRIINQNLRMDKNLDEQQELNQIHPAFFSALQERADNGLTRLDLKYCAYILIGLDNKEISNRLGVDPKSIRMGRYRLKQKLKLNKDDNLDHFIKSVDNVANPPRNGSA